MTGAELKELRRSKRLTQSKLAEMARIPNYMAISKYENGFVRITESMALLFEILLK